MKLRGQRGMVGGVYHPSSDHDAFISLDEEDLQIGKAGWERTHRCFGQTLWFHPQFSTRYMVMSAHGTWVFTNLFLIVGVALNFGTYVDILKSDAHDGLLPPGEKS